MVSVRLAYAILLGTETDGLLMSPIGEAFAVGSTLIDLPEIWDVQLIKSRLKCSVNVK